ncbi:hypothetical protein HHK36_018974 [Tetracentron sinense]|uniref:non-specific serine/threonine protein kinase n=1 Tax=Tetracentron sinense TaxID=13715 RepID=A0A834YWL1_TETSI|nr:hypothetical protein HHK36_018974 [Tetracentron sinense]
MGWFPCSGKSNKKSKKPDDQIQAIPDKLKVNPLLDIKEEVSKDGGSDHIAAQIFTFRDLAAATKNFKADCLLGEGGFGRVYKGRLDKINQIVAIKQLDRNGLQGNREFLVEVLMLSLLHHPNLVNLIGYCADGDQRLLVYEYMPLRSLEDHLHDLPADKKRLDWNTRIKIAAGAAKGLEYLHDKARPLFKDRRKFSQIADPMLQGQYPVRGLYQALAVAAMCLQEQPTMRPLIADVVTALTYLASQTYGSDNRPVQSSCIAPSTPKQNGTTISNSMVAMGLIESTRWRTKLRPLSLEAS